MFPGDIAATNSVLGGGTSVSQGLFMEMFFTSLLVFVVLMLAAEKSQDTFIAPIGIGLALFVAMIAGKPCRVKCGLHQQLADHGYKERLTLADHSTRRGVLAVLWQRDLSQDITGFIGSGHS